MSENRPKYGKNGLKSSKFMQKLFGNHIKLVTNWVKSAKI